MTIVAQENGLHQRKHINLTQTYSLKTQKWSKIALGQAFFSPIFAKLRAEYSAMKLKTFPWGDYRRPETLPWSFTPYFIVHLFFISRPVFFKLDSSSLIYNRLFFNSFGANLSSRRLPLCWVLRENLRGFFCPFFEFFHRFLLNKSCP